MGEAKRRILLYHAAPGLGRRRGDRNGGTSLLHGWDIGRLRDVYNKWGPDLRTCRRLITHPEEERNYEAYVKQDVAAVLFDNMVHLLLGPAEHVPDSIFICDGGSEAPDLERYAILHFAVRGERVRQLMAAAVALFTREQQVAFFVSLAAVEPTRAVAKNVLAEWMYAFFNDKSLGRRRPMCTLSDGSVFMLPLAENVQSLEDWLQHPDPSDFPVFLRPKAMNPSVDGVFVDSHRIILFRMTTSGSEKIDLENEIARRLKDALPSEWTQSWVFVFAVPTRPMAVAYLQRAPVTPTAFGKNVQFGSFVCKSSRHEDEEL
ncbi:hypothetical protein EWM64_g10306 [Hericium alpestre]|uniref:Uncharacterized protein n=1 Tax=Hericium alpestre TaxID=135208 RepID=A0A4Y9ZG18_9AGAM|nr:hypothetical protein EWM64_g10306 [Hericium alpestre]